MAETLAVFGDALYVAAPGLIRRLNGTNPIAQLATSNPPAAPIGLAIDANFVYYTDRGTAPNYTDGIVARVPINGGTPFVLARNLPNPWGIAIDANYVYWANNATNGNVWRVPK